MREVFQVGPMAKVDATTWDGDGWREGQDLRDAAARVG